jgi:anti-anti-sigma factor
MSIKSLITAVRFEPDTAIIDLRGEINADAEEDLNAAYTEAIASEPDRIALNFTGIDYINSTGIALIVGILARARKDHVALLAYGISEHYLEICRITRLIDFMQVFPDEETAITGHE